MIEPSAVSPRSKWRADLCCCCCCCHMYKRAWSGASVSWLPAQRAQGCLSGHLAAKAPWMLIIRTQWHFFHTQVRDFPTSGSRDQQGPKSPTTVARILRVLAQRQGEGPRDESAVPWMPSWCGLKQRGSDWLRRTQMCTMLTSAKCLVSFLLLSYSWTLFEEVQSEVKESLHIEFRSWDTWSAKCNSLHAPVFSHQLQILPSSYSHSWGFSSLGIP